MPTKKLSSFIFSLIIMSSILLGCSIAYYDGHIYHIGYLIDEEKNDEEMQEKMLQLVREYIIASKFPNE